MFRVSEVEAFRQWRDDEEADLERLLAQLTWNGEESEAMRVGTAFHKALELASDGESDSIEAMGYTFKFPSDIEISIPEFREFRLSKVYHVDGHAVTITGQVDGLHGLRIEDHKTTRRFDADRYMAGYQWRLYLDIFKANHFRWNIFEIADVDGEYYEVKSLHKLDQYRYPAMTADCESLVADFHRFVRQHLPQRAA